MKVHFDIDDVSFTFVEKEKKKAQLKHWVLEEDPGILIFERSDNDYELMATGQFPKLFTKLGLDYSDLLTLFKKALLQEQTETNEDSLSGIEDTEEEEVDSYSKSIKYDPEKIRLDPKQFSTREVISMMDENEIDLSPDFQRFFVWKEIKKQSSLIESILLRIPLPVFYLAQHKKSYYQVIDGVQRLTVIHRFVNNKFRLKDLEYFKQCEKCYFKDLDSVYQTRIRRTMLNFNVLDPETPAHVKYDIFKRLNQGGKPLKGQEIRNSIASKETRNLIKSLAKSEEFINATLGDINPIRMQDQELVLRFIAFYDDFDFKKGEFRKYKSDMEEFLNSKVDELNEDNSRHAEYAKTFLETMNNANHLFGKYAFRKINSEYLKSKDQKKILINKSLFTAWTVVLSQYPHSKIKKMPKEALVQSLAIALEKDKNYQLAVTQGTNQRDRLKKSIEKAFELMEAL
ncbi:MAG: DUF262 domain-containing protein [Leptospiraceae bacterium]|nr:DUF262 domain-containing protein [Leptospiraceae bacterium]